MCSGVMFRSPDRGICWLESLSLTGPAAGKLRGVSTSEEAQLPVLSMIWISISGLIGEEISYVTRLSHHRVLPAIGG